MTLVCITNDMPDIRSCTVRGQHTDHCDGTTPTGKECKGCLPRTARHGLLCGTCWDGVVEGVNGFGRILDLFDGVDRAVQHDNAGVRSQGAPPIPISSLQLALDEVRSYGSNYPGTPEGWVSTVNGAEAAARFARAYWALTRNHPTEETAHRIRRTRCTKCRQLSLVWTPPRYFGDQVKVTCHADGCGLEMDQQSFETIAVIEKPQKEEAA